jgi:hypothetical protein
LALIDEAIQACEAAGQQSLPGSLGNLRDEIEAINDRLGDLHSDIDAERQEAENFGDPEDAEQADQSRR